MPDRESGFEPEIKKGNDADHNTKNLSVLNVKPSHGNKL